MVVDDDQVNVKLTKARLEGEGYEVVVATDGDVGLEKAQSEKPDLIILDVEMPRMNGYTFMSQLIKIEGIKHIPVIVLTAHNDMQPIFKLKGVRDYVVKPINFDKLLEKLNQCLS